MIRTESVRRLSTASTTRAFWSVSSVLRRSTLDSLPLPVRGNLSARVTTPAEGSANLQNPPSVFAYLMDYHSEGRPWSMILISINETDYDAAAGDRLSLTRAEREDKQENETQCLSCQQ